MFGEPIARVAETIGEARQIERIVQGRGPGRGRGHRRQIEDGKRNHPASLRFVASTAAIGALEHDPEKREPVFRKDHAQLKCWSANRFNYETLRSSAVRRQSRHG